MKIKRFLLILIAAILVLSGCGEVTGEYDIPDFSQDSGQIGILAWDAPGGDYYRREEHWQWVAEAGYNYIICLPLDFNVNPQTYLEALDWAQDNGMKMIVIDTAMSNVRENAGNGLNVPSDNKNVHHYKNHPAFYGIFICDEPDRVNWGYVNDRMEDCKGEFGEDKILFLNLCNVYDHPTLDLQYDEVFETIPNINFLSFDGYSMMDTGSVLPSFFSDTAITRYYAKNYNALSCNFILISGGYYNYRNCSEKDIRWQMNVMLAYGYDIIGQFTYSSFGSSEELINDSGMRTDHYYKVQKVNNEIRAIEKIYKHYEWQGTAVVDGKYPDNSDFLCESLPLEFIEEETPGIQKIESDENLLCGIFKDSNNNMAYMLTNAINPYRNLDTTVKVKFDRAYKGVIVIDKNYNEADDLSIIPLENGECTITLESGEGKFIIPLKYK